MIKIDKNTGRPMYIVDRLVEHKEIRDLFNKYGNVGIIYAIMFGWEGSSFRSVVEERERHNMIVREIKTNDWVDEYEKVTEVFAPVYQTNVMLAAIERINVFFPVPEFKSRNYLIGLVENNRSMLTIIQQNVELAIRRSKSKRKNVVPTVVDGKAVRVGPLSEEKAKEKDDLSSKMKEFATTQKTIVEQIATLEKEIAKIDMEIAGKMSIQRECTLLHFITKHRDA